MDTQSSIHFYTSWAKGRLDEMDAAVSAIESKIGAVQADARDKANNVLADLKARRDAFRATVHQQAEANEAAWTNAKAKLESEWHVFETDVKNYVESYGDQAQLKAATFKLQAAAQVNAWREAADRLGATASKFTAERRADLDSVVSSMKADAAAAEARLQKLHDVGAQSWSALMTALSESRAAFDRANQASRDAFKRAS